MPEQRSAEDRYVVLILTDSGYHHASVMFASSDEEAARMAVGMVRRDEAIKDVAVVRASEMRRVET